MKEFWKTFLKTATVGILACVILNWAQIIFADEPLPDDCSVSCKDGAPIHHWWWGWICTGTCATTESCAGSVCRPQWIQGATEPTGCKCVKATGGT